MAFDFLTEVFSSLIDPTAAPLVEHYPYRLASYYNNSNFTYIEMLVHEEARFC